MKPVEYDVYGKIRLPVWQELERKYDMNILGNVWEIRIGIGDEVYEHLYDAMWEVCR